MTVEFDTANIVRVPKLRKGGNAIRKAGGKTLRVGGGRRGGRGVRR